MKFEINKTFNGKLMTKVQLIPLNSSMMFYSVWDIFPCPIFLPKLETRLAPTVGNLVVSTTRHSKTDNNSNELLNVPHKDCFSNFLSPQWPKVTVSYRKASLKLARLFSSSVS